MKRLEFKLNWFEHRGKSNYLIAQEYYDNWLAEMLASATVVYGNATQFDIVSSPTSADTHKALLIQIEELPKVECKHVPESYGLGHHILYKCKHCKAELKVKWEPK